MASILQKKLQGPFNVILDFEEAVIEEKNMSFPGAAVASRTDLPRICGLVERVIRPLEQERGIEAFLANLAIAHSGICGGTLRELREVEVVLVSSGRVSGKPAPKSCNPELTSLSGAPNLPKCMRDFEIT